MTSFDEIFDLTAGVHYFFYNVICTSLGTLAASGHQSGNVLVYPLPVGGGATAVAVPAPDTVSAVHDNRKEMAVRARGIMTATVVLSLHPTEIQMLWSQSQPERRSKPNSRNSSR